MIRKILFITTEYSYWILGIVVILTGIFSLSITELKEDRDILNFLPKGRPEMKLFLETSKKFKGLNVMLVGVKSKELFTYRGLLEFRKLQDKLSFIDGVRTVLSFTELPLVEVDEVGIKLLPLVPEVIPREKKELEKIKDRVLKNRQVRGRLVSDDGESALILVYIRDDVSPTDVSFEVKRRAKQWCPKFFELYFGGLPIIQAETAYSSKKDIIYLSPYVICVFVILAFLFLRRWKTILLSLSMVFITTVFVLEIMYLFSIPLTIVTTSLPMILVATAGSYGAHLIGQYYRFYSLPLKERIEKALNLVVYPIIFSAVTTALGFFSLVLMDIKPMQHYGIVTGSGVILTALLTLLVIPAFLWRFEPEVSPSAFVLNLGKPLKRVVKRLVKVKRSVLATFFILLLGILPFTLKVKSDPTLKGVFRSESEIGVGEEFLERYFGGTLYLQVYIKGDIKEPETLYYIRDIVDYAWSLPQTSDVNSILEPLQIVMEGMSGQRSLPKTKAQIESLIPFLSDNVAIKQLVTSKWDSGLIQVRIKVQSGDELIKLIDKFDNFLKGLPKSVKLIDIGKVSKEEKNKLKEIKIGYLLKRLNYYCLRYNIKFDREGVVKFIREGEKFDNISVEEKDLILSKWEEFFLSPTSPWEPPNLTKGEEEALLELTLIGDNKKRFLSSLREKLPSGIKDDEEGIKIVADLLWDMVIDIRSEIISRRLIEKFFKELSLERKEEIKLILKEVSDERIVIESKGGVKVSSLITGPVIINKLFAESTLRNQLVSFLFSFITMFIFVLVIFKDLKLSVYSLVPSIAGVIFIFGYMGVAKINMDTGTAMVASIALGMGVDYAIHYLWALKNEKIGIKGDIIVERVGPPIIFNALQVALSFSVLIFAYTLPISNFGKLTTFGFLVVGILTIVILPLIEFGKLVSRNHK